VKCRPGGQRRLPIRSGNAATARVLRHTSPRRCSSGWSSPSHAGVRAGARGSTSSLRYPPSPALQHWPVSSLSISQLAVRPSVERPRDLTLREWLSASLLFLSLRWSGPSSRCDKRCQNLSGQNSPRLSTCSQHLSKNKNPCNPCSLNCRRNLVQLAFFSCGWSATPVFHRNPPHSRRSPPATMCCVLRRPNSALVSPNPPRNTYGGFPSIVRLRHVSVCAYLLVQLAHRVGADRCDPQGLHDLFHTMHPQRATRPISPHLDHSNKRGVARRKNFDALSKTTPIVPSSSLAKAVKNQVWFFPWNIMVRRVYKCAVGVS
jgi:hypothetical protein